MLLYVLRIFQILLLTVDFSDLDFPFDEQSGAMAKKSSSEHNMGQQPFHFSRQLGLQVGHADHHEPVLTAVDQEEQILTASQPAYTEGGLVFLPHEDGKRTSSLDEKASRLSAILASYGDLDWGFKRRERLDVKKPGPPFLTNSFAFVVKAQKHNRLIFKHKSIITHKI